MKRPYIIAEIGFNHGGNIKLAERMIRAAAKAGADAVKFQSFKADDLYLPSNSVYAIIKPGELSVADHRQLKKLADSLKVDFLSTPFSVAWVDGLDKMGVKGFKVASMDMANHHLLKAVAKKKKTVYLATGVGSLEEVKESVKVLKKHGARDIILLHCISNYPTQPQDIHLGFMADIAKATGLPVGFSDHSLGVAASLAAIALGATVIEKHFTTDKNLKGPDHKMSLDPVELKALVEGAKVVAAAMAPLKSVKKRPDIGNRAAMRRGIYAAAPIAKGEKLTMDKLKFVRPEVTPMSRLEGLLKKKASKNYAVNEPVA